MCALLPCPLSFPEQIKSLQGAGPNPELETELVTMGNSRETVRFFMEVHGEDKAKLLRLLERHQRFVDQGFSEDGVREALTVVEGGTDDGVVEYLKGYRARMEQYDRLEAAIRGMPLSTPGAVGGPAAAVAARPRPTGGSGAAAGVVTSTGGYKC